MKLSAFALVLLACASAVPQTQSRPGLLEALHCIRAVDSNWLDSPLAERKVLVAGYIRDSESYPGYTHLMVVIYETQSRGAYFDMVLEVQGTKHLMTLANAGAFKLRSGKLDFSPPDGGLWTQDYIERGIRKAMRRPRTQFSLQTVLKSPPELTCKSYLPD